MADFHKRGKEEETKDLLEIAVMTGKVTGNVALIKLMGTLSATTALLDILMTEASTSASDTGEKAKSWAGTGEGWTQEQRRTVEHQINRQEYL